MHGRVPRPFGKEMTHDGKENSPREGEGTAIPARYPGGPEGTSAIGVPVSNSERQGEASENVGRYLHPGPREDAGLDWQLTSRSVEYPGVGAGWPIAVAEDAASGFPPPSRRTGGGLPRRAGPGK